MAYDSTNQRLYTDTLAEPPIGISTEEVRVVLAEAAGVDLCASSYINKWAKYKPLQIGGEEGYTDTEAKAANYGLYVPYYSSFRDMVYDIRRGEWGNAINYFSTKTPWGYQRVGSDDYSRILDFDGYRHLAPAPVGEAQVYRSTVGIGLTPGFFFELAAYDTEYLTLSDIGVKESGVDYRGSNMYVGVVVCDGYDATYIYDTHNFWAMSGLTATQLNTEIIRRLDFDNDFAFNRGAQPPTFHAPVCLFLSSARNVTLNSTGVFIPVIPSRKVIDITFIAPAITPITYDSMNAWYFDGTDDLTLIVKCFPNGNFTGKFDVNIEDYLGNAWAWNNDPSSSVDAYRLVLTLNVVKELIDGVEVQRPVYLQFSTATNGSTRVINAYSYLVTTDTDFDDIRAGHDHAGNPLVATSYDTEDIRGGSIMHGVTPAQASISVAFLDYWLGPTSTGYIHQPLFEINPSIH